MLHTQCLVSLVSLSRGVPQKGLSGVSLLIVGLKMQVLEKGLLFKEAGPEGMFWDETKRAVSKAGPRKESLTSRRMTWKIESHHLVVNYDVLMKLNLLRHPT